MCKALSILNTIVSAPHHNRWGYLGHSDMVRLTQVKLLFSWATMWSLLFFFLNKCLIIKVIDAEAWVGELHACLKCLGLCCSHWQEADQNHGLAGIRGSTLFWNAGVPSSSLTCCASRPPSDIHVYMFNVCVHLSKLNLVNGRNGELKRHAVNKSPACGLQWPTRLTHECLRPFPPLHPTHVLYVPVCLTQASSVACRLFPCGRLCVILSV